MTAKVKAAPASITEIKATAPPLNVECRSCTVTLAPGAPAFCMRCAASDRERAREEARRPVGGLGAGALRRWTLRRFLMGQITQEVRAELELCADDIEVGHG